MPREQLTLPGPWELRLDGQPDWHPAPVPGCWEDVGFPKDRPGPVWYRTRLEVPPHWSGRRIWLEFGAVSYACEVFVDDQPVGAHIGMWDSFAVEIGAAVAPGASVELLVRVEKPASLTAGPDSPSVPGRFPQRETLAGFLPYVWGHTFGGIWQPVTLASTGATVIEDAWAHGDERGQLVVEATLSGAAALELTVADPDGREVARAEQATAGGLTRFELAIPAPQPWSPGDPRRYRATLRAGDDDERVISFGLRSVRPAGATLLLNGRPIYPRMILSWGWYPTTLSASPGPEQVRADFARLKALGYNGVKLCLWLPPPYYFELADELGLLLWVELPMWLPRPTGHFRHQAPLEYAALVRQARRHPSVIVYSLGCELSRDVSAEILGPLYQLVRGMCGDALLRDNSGSGEAYGGLLTEFAEYYDYHFYSDLQFFRGLLDYFAPRWRAEQPWLFGEYCDYDTFRDLARLDSPPWWASQSPEVNPQGARWQFDAPWLAERLRANGMEARGAELERLSELHGLLHRKWTIELTRTYREIAGYVITGEADTPISTAGMWDAAGRLKFDARQFRMFNADLVALLGWDKRRDWVRGGDRPAYWDTWSYTAGALVRPHLIAAHYGLAGGAAEAAWSVAFDDEPPFAAGLLAPGRSVAPGEVREVGVAEFVAPEVRAPRRAMLRVALAIGDERTTNEWPLWFFPTGVWEGLRGVALYDPLGRLGGLASLAPRLASVGRADLLGGAPQTVDLRSSRFVVVATQWDDAIERFVRDGGSAVLLQGEGPPGPLAAVELPFWREALRLCEPHPAWGDFPHDGWAGLQFFACAADRALDTAPLAEQIRPILRRLDNRTMAIHDYAAELRLGGGRLIVTTLRFEGGLGEQPVGLQRSPAAAYLLACFVRALG